MTLYVLRVERRADTIPNEPLSRRIRLAATRHARIDADRQRRTLAA